MNATQVIIKEIVLISIIIFLPIKTAALEMIDVDWEDVSPEISENSSHGKQNLYNFQDTIYLTRYDSSGPISEDYPYTLAKLNNDGTWQYLIQHYTNGFFFKNELIYRNALYVKFGPTTYRFNDGGIISPTIACTDYGQYTAFAFKKWLFLPCSQQLSRMHKGRGPITAISMPDNYYLQGVSGIEFKGIFYLVGESNNSDSTGSDLAGYKLTSNDDFVSDGDLPKVRNTWHRVFTFIYNHGLYLHAGKKLFVTTDGKEWKQLRRFQDFPDAVGNVGENIYELFENHKRNTFYYSVDGGMAWHRLQVTDFELTSMLDMNEQKNRIYVIGVDSDEQLVVLYSQDLDTWYQLGEQTFESVADIEVTSDFVYVVTDQSEVYRASI